MRPPLCLPLTASLLLAATAAARDEPPAVKLTLHPAGEPVPALKYRLLPELRDRQSGNALQFYLRAFSPDWYVGREARGNPDLDRKLDIWLATAPLRELPLKEMEWIATSKGLREVDRAARRSYCDWEQADRYRADGIGMLMPEIQSMRTFARFLAIRARMEVAQGKFAEATYTLQTGLQMARHLNEGPTLIHSLIGTASAAIMLNRLEELIQQPGAPNLYWALTDLPRPFIDLRTAFQGERITMDWMFPGARALLADAKAPPPSPGKVREMFRTVERAEQGEADQTGGGGLAWLEEGAKTLPDARQVLIEQGRTPEQVDALPGRVANLLLEIHSYDRAFDDLLKWQSLPYSMAVEGQKRGFAREEDRDHIKGRVLAGMLVPAANKVTFSPVRTDRTIAALRVVEAIRLHAAAHGGQLPAKLTDITAVPIPDDPATGKPFEYTVTGDRAILAAPPPAGAPRAAGNYVRYELALAR